MFSSWKVSGRSVSREGTANERQTQMKSKYVILSVFVALAGFLPQSKAQGTLDSAEGFAVLGGSTVTSTGDTIITGDLGVSPGTSITGFYPPGIVNGTIYNDDPVAAQAEADTLTAYNNLAGEPVDSNLTGQDLGTLVLSPGVYKFNSSAQLTGTLTLSGNGYYVFQIGSTLTTASSSFILLSNGDSSRRRLLASRLLRDSRYRYVVCWEYPRRPEHHHEYRGKPVWQSLGVKRCRDVG